MITSQKKNDFFQGFRYGLPVMLGYFPVSFAFAVWAVGNGLPWFVALLISMTNFTSAGQQAGASLLIAGGSLPEIGVTVFVINIRYMLMSISLSQKMLHIPLFKRCLLANGVTDEIYFLAMQKDGKLSGWFFTGLATGPYMGWVLGSLAGALAGDILPAALTSALGIALYAMFIAIVTPVARGSKSVTLVALAAVFLSTLFKYLPGLNRLPSGWALIVCALAASLLGALLFPLPDGETKDGEEEVPAG